MEWVEECETDCGFLSNARCNPEIDPNNCRWVRKEISFFVTITEPSDGQVTAGSQHHDPVPADRVYRAVGANHLEAGNHIEITNRMNEIFDRGDVFGINRQ